MGSQTDFQVKNLKPRDKRYTEWEARGFGVRVTPNGVRWMTLGTYPMMSLAEAHEAHGEP